MLILPVALLLAAEPTAAPAAAQTLIDGMSAAALATDCKTLNPVWKEATRVRASMSKAFGQAVDNLHARRQQFRCLEGCKSGDDCPPVVSLDTRWKEYLSLHARLLSCVEKETCPKKEVQELQSAWQPIARVLLGEIKPTDSRWSELVSGFAMLVGVGTSAGAMLTAIAELPPEQRRALDSKKLSHAAAVLLGGVPVDKIDDEDLPAVLGFTASVLTSEPSRPKTRDALEKLRKEWAVVLAIMDKTRSPGMRTAIDRTLDTLIKRYTSDPVKAAKYRDLKKDLAANSTVEGAAKVARALDITELEEAQLAAIRAGVFPIILADYRAMRLYTMVDLPHECPADVRSRSDLCQLVYQIADQFLLVLDGRALNGTTPMAPASSSSLDSWIDAAAKALKRDPAAPKTFTGQFAGGVGLQIRINDANPVTLVVRARYIVKTLADDPGVFDTGEEIRKDVGAQTVDVGKDLAGAALQRSTLLNAFDRIYFQLPSAPPVSKQPLEPPGRDVAQHRVAPVPPVPPVPPVVPPPGWHAAILAGARQLEMSNGRKGAGWAVADVAMTIAGGTLVAMSVSARNAAEHGNGTVERANVYIGLGIGALVSVGVLRLVSGLSSSGRSVSFRDEDR